MGRWGAGTVCTTRSEFRQTPVPEFPAVPAQLCTDVCRFATAINRPPRIFPEETQKYFGVCSW